MTHSPLLNSNVYPFWFLFWRVVFFLCSAFIYWWSWNKARPFKGQLTFPIHPKFRSNHQQNVFVSSQRAEQTNIPTISSYLSIKEKIVLHHESGNCHRHVIVRTRHSFLIVSNSNALLVGTQFSTRENEWDGEWALTKVNGFIAFRAVGHVGMCWWTRETDGVSTVDRMTRVRWSLPSFIPLRRTPSVVVPSANGADVMSSIDLYTLSVNVKGP